MKQLIIKYTFFLITILALLLSCDDNVEINIGNITEPVTAQFQVDFDGNTWVADRTTAIVEDDQTVITGYKNNDQESVVITLNNSEVGTYIFAENTIIGKIEYFETPSSIPFTSEIPNPIGRVDITDRDLIQHLISGSFFSILKRFTEQLDANGNPVLDANGDIVYDEESKNFTNGIFSNIVFTTTIVDPNTTTNEFFVKIDGTEFVETALAANTVSVTGNDVIVIRASRNGSNEVVQLQMPADIVTGNYLLIGILTDPANDTVATYQILSPAQIYGATAGNIQTPLLRITLHNTTTKRIEGTFEFTAEQLGGSATHDFTEGAFKITYN